MATITYNTTAPYRNNMVGATPVTGAATIDAITSDLEHFEFGIKWTGNDGAVSLASTPAISLSTEAIGSSAFTAANTDPLYIEWVAGTLAGTIKENFYSDGVLILSRDNQDPGYGSVSVGGATVDAGRYGPQYAFVYSAGRFEIYSGLKIEVGQVPLVSVPRPASLSSLFPSLTNGLRLVMNLPVNIAVRNIQLAGLKNLVKASFRKEEQIRYFGSLQSRFFIKIYQKPKPANGPQGVPLRIIAPPL